MQQLQFNSYGEHVALAISGPTLLNSCSKLVHSRNFERHNRMCWVSKFFQQWNHICNTENLISQRIDFYVRNVLNSRMHLSSEKLDRVIFQTPANRGKEKGREWDREGRVGRDRRERNRRKWNVRGQRGNGQWTEGVCFIDLRTRGWWSAEDRSRSRLPSIQEFRSLTSRALRFRI